VVEADSEEQVQSRLEEDPWTMMDVLTTSAIEPWEVLIGHLATR
jgi:hypothetical protein